MIINAETITAHNANKIQRLFLKNEITAEGAISFLTMICDLDEGIAEHIVSTWQIRDETPGAL